jgi:Icc protein
MKIIHISDLHLDAVYKQENYTRTIQLLEYITATGFDHLVITGDVTENSDKSALKLARGVFKKFGLLDADKTTIIIGNHDIFGGVHLAEDVLNFPKKCKTTGYNQKVEDFTSAFVETYENTISDAKGNAYPFVKEFDEFVLLGLNSIAKYSVLKNPFASNGTVSIEQIDAAEKMFYAGRYENKKVITMIHHHLCKEPVKSNPSESSMWQKIEKQTMKLRNKKSLIKFFNRINSELVLHGHLHESAEYMRKGIKFLNAGGSVLDDNKAFLNVNRIEINSNGITTSTENIRTNTREESPFFFPASSPSPETKKVPTASIISLN